MIRFFFSSLLFSLFFTTAGYCKIEQWGIFELSLNGPSNGNPFTEVQLSARFTHGDKSFEPEGFYDGDGVYKVRFMPDEQGEWKYVTKSNCKELDGKTGEFACIKPSPGNHGPVRVRKTYYFAYADGTPYFEIGTTCYAWVHQGDKLEEQTLATLKESPFNKIRMCVFPKHYIYNNNEPKYYAFEGKPKRNWDFSRFNPEFFRHFEKRVGQLRDIGIQADFILFHPYDNWGFKNMGDENNVRYLHYIVARLAAYRNVWWSFANEYDLLDWPMADWDKYFQLVRKEDPYNHLRGIHNCEEWYDHTKTWVTHASVQSSDFNVAIKLREKYKKPIVYDECKYEGDISEGWGHLTPQQMVNPFWLGTMSGCYVGHGETYLDPHDILWWSKGGVLHGQSPARIVFLKKIMQQWPLFEDLVPSRLPSGCYMLSKPGQYYLIYFLNPTTAKINLPGTKPYKIDSIDTWNMTVVAVGSASPGEFTFTAVKEHTLIRLSLYKPGEKVKPEAKATAKPEMGMAPLKVQFSTPSKLQCKWDFGDNASSSESNPVHVYSKPDIYTVKLTVTDEMGQSSNTFLQIIVDSPQSSDSIVRVGFKNNESAPVILHENIVKQGDGSYDLGDNEPWKWISVGNKPLDALEQLRSFTIMGWLNASSMETGAGGNRVAFNLNFDRSGFDLVCLRDGRMRLAVNEWPDVCDNDSSTGKITIGKWVFFAVTYNGIKGKNNVNWYFGSQTSPAQLDRTTTYVKGPIDKGSGKLTIGNYNETLQTNGLDRQFRGELRGIQIFGSQISSSGALPLSKILKHQRDK